MNSQPVFGLFGVSPMLDRKRKPVIVLAGFLGAGKTTLLKHLLQSDHGYRVAVIVNEFADVGIDGTLVKDASDTPMVEMSNGCICCSLLGGLEDTLAKLAQANQIERFDWLVIETTGLADPGPIAQTFLVEGPTQESFELNGVITLVDANHHRIQEAEAGILWAAQVVGAHTILINKTDLVSAGELSALQSRIQKLNPLAAIHQSEQSRIDMRHIFTQQQNALLTIPVHRHDDHAHCDQHGHCEPGHHDHHHDTTAPYTSVCLEVAGELDAQLFNAWFGGLLRTKGTKLPRAKGILAVRGRPRAVVIQSVFEQSTVENGAAWGDEARINKLVIIGRKEVMLADDLTAGFLSCLVVN